MNKINIATALSLALFALVSCSKQDAPLPSEMVFDAQHPATKATASAFEPGDKMGIYVTKYQDSKPSVLQVSGNYANNSAATLEAGKWKASPAIYWEEGKFDIYAYYPYTTVASVDEMPFSVALDQGVPESQGGLSAYEASDFLWAKASAVSQSASVPLNFTHRMSRLVINLVKGEDYEGDIPSDATVIIHNTIPKAVIDLSVGIVVKDNYAPAQSIKAAKINDSRYEVILVPQRIDTRRPLIEVITKGVSYMIERTFIFRQGTQHTINVILSDNPDRMRIEIGGEIEGWAN